MPIYEFECQESDCDCIVELEIPITGPIPEEVDCPECGKICKKIISKCSFKLVGEWPGNNFKRGLDYP